MASDVKVDDSIYEKAGQILERSACDFEKTLEEFGNLLDEVSDSGLMVGETADAFRMFIANVRQFADILENQGVLVRTELYNLISDLDHIDGDLY